MNETPQQSGGAAILDNDQVVDFLDELEDLKEEDGLSRGVVERIDEMANTMREPIDMLLRLDKVKSILEELDGNQHLPMHLRTRLMYLSAQIESFSGA